MTWINEFRPLSKQERAILARLLEASFPGRDEIEAQLPHAMVREIAGPGDHEGTVEFKVDTKVKAPVKWSVPVIGMAQDEDAVEVDFVLHIRDGIIAELEIVKADGSALQKMPAATAIKVEVPDYKKHV
jgi:hypothetical protein